MEFIISGSTDIGIVKKTNQDSLRVMSITTGIGKMTFAVLCDGMGGLSHGEVASASLVYAFEQWAKNTLPELCQQGITDEKIREDWTNIICITNDKIKEYGGRLGIALGTTIVAMLITQTRYYVVNVGDSRVYSIYKEAAPITKDQTVVAREVELGMITPEQAKVDPRRSVLLQCVGASDVVYPDLFFGTPQKDAVYMLCSDGFRHVITRDELHSYLHPARLVSHKAMKEAELALIQLNKQRQERDNISVVTIRTY